MFRPDLLSGKRVLITGGGTGIGLSIGRRLLGLGASLAICGRREEVLAETAKSLEAETGGKVAYKGCDIRDASQVDSLLDWAFADAPLDILVNNAAGNFISRSEDLSPRAVDAVLGIVLHGTSYVTLGCGKRWLAAGHKANVLSIITTYAWTGSGYVVPSACGKAGVLALTRSLAVEWAKYNIRSNAIAPGPFPTEGAWSRLLPGELVKKFDPALRVPLKRVGELQELANLAAYLISDYSAYVNGEVITIDGGEWLRSGGEFSHLEMIPDQMWDQMEKSRGK